MALPDGVRGILLDIEGTTTPVQFVYEVLFPFARERLGAAIARASEDPELGAALELLRKDWHSERSTGDDPVPEFGADYARFVLDQDRKSTGLKALQGLIWREGYATGALRGPVFDDVPQALAAWREAGLRVAIFSSGSVLAQRLLFGHTSHGDLSHHLAGWFDTSTGPKREARSYLAIARQLGLVPEALLFLSDVTAELDAAHEAGLATGLVLRPGNAPVGPSSHPSYRSFAELW